MPLYGTSPSAVWLWDESATDYVNLTSLGIRLGARQPLMAESGDFLYIGHDRRFDALVWWLSSTGPYPGAKWECSVTGGWKTCYPVQDREWEFDQVHDYLQFDLESTGLRDWEPMAATMFHGMTPPEATAYYWLRVSAPTISRAAQLEGVTLRPFTTLGTPTNVQQQLQIRTPFSETTNPSFTTVEKLLRGAEDAIFRITGHYYRPDFVEAEMLDFKAFGMALRNRPVLDILGLDVWNGNDWEEKDIGRTDDWHYEPRTGMIYISTIFLDVVPPILRRGYSNRRQQGAFKRGVRLRYVHGHDSRIDNFAQEIERVVVKQACLDIMINRDFNQLLPQNLDRVSVEKKIDEWRKDVESFTDRYSKLVMF